MSQFLLKGHKILNFLFAFFVKISGTLKTHTSGTEVNGENGEKISSWFLTVFYLAKKSIKNFDAQAL